MKTNRIKTTFKSYFTFEKSIIASVRKCFTKENMYSLGKNTLKVLGVGLAFYAATSLIPQSNHTYIATGSVILLWAIYIISMFYFIAKGLYKLIKLMTDENTTFSKAALAKSLLNCFGFFITMVLLLSLASNAVHYISKNTEHNYKHSIHNKQDSK
ncbi:hypothetical protein GHU64_06755 [Pseudomonas aeruginosa]|nr:hypothetical protein [Pseudomonas aeruginosa]